MLRLVVVAPCLAHLFLVVAHLPRHHKDHPPAAGRAVRGQRLGLPPRRQEGQRGVLGLAACLQRLALRVQQPCAQLGPAVVQLQRLPQQAALARQLEGLGAQVGRGRQGVEVAG